MRSCSPSTSPEAARHGSAGATAYWGTQDIDAEVARLAALGAEILLFALLEWVVR